MAVRSPLAALPSPHPRAAAPYTPSSRSRAAAWTFRRYALSVRSLAPSRVRAYARGSSDKSSRHSRVNLLGPLRPSRKSADSVRSLRSFLAAAVRVWVPSLQVFRSPQTQTPQTMGPPVQHPDPFSGSPSCLGRSLTGEPTRFACGPSRDRSVQCARAPPEPLSLRG
jgi:hypothetical protein